jgi:hypothetical protein
MSKGFGRIQKRRQRLETVKDPLRDLNEMVPWEVFRKEFEPLGRKERKAMLVAKPSGAARSVMPPSMIPKPWRRS